VTRKLSRFLRRFVRRFNSGPSRQLIWLVRANTLRFTAGQGVGAAVEGQVVEATVD
jgi:hypothetical protein